MTADQELTVAEAAARLGVNAETIRRYMRAQQLRGYQLSRKSGWRVYADSVDALKSQHASQPEPTAAQPPEDAPTGASQYDFFFRPTPEEMARMAAKGVEQPAEPGDKERFRERYMAKLAELQASIAELQAELAEQETDKEKPVSRLRTGGPKG